MFKETPDDAGHFNVVAHARHTGAQTAHAAHEQIDLHACLRRLIQQLDHPFIYQRIDLEDELTLLAFALLFDLAFDQRFHPRPHINRRNDQFAEVCFL